MRHEQPFRECPSCRAEVHPAATACRYCQRPIRRRAGVLPTLLVIVLIVVVAGRLFGSKHPDTAAAATAAPGNTVRLVGKDDPSLPALVRKEYALNEDCRGGNVGPDSPVCRQRDAVAVQLTRMHWCYGEPGDDGASSAWHECVAREKDPISSRHVAWISECQRAIRADLNDPGSADFPAAVDDANAFAHLQSDQTEQNDAAHLDSAALDTWNSAHPEAAQETITFKFHAKNLFGGVQRYAGFCTFQDNFDGSAKLVDHTAGAD